MSDRLGRAEIPSVWSSASDLIARVRELGRLALGLRSDRPFRIPSPTARALAGKTEA